ncbi:MULTISPECIES: hypothetical protein [Rhizobium]|uniref:Uncharacterized protein n=1 Tax=Rhizobium tropici TaxID=398 RepID=A0A6P1C4P3_RHITR|nr:MULTISPECIES: hypothetical protein [Rhizobium]AGB71282.1 hypothetical protein RTCIAT899_CH09480 [Rhizobium tropici CIAT 899]MBB4240359.1 hypothetical protein [Rhizobium tropici]MBB5591629.1 hypothetical protein [Rhizobium tropici]MBB6490287.1 hypothetical protein [Rhizobium tropici]NEV11222.1 hypothetical protein [Rhizobium tropici]
MTSHDTSDNILSDQKLHDLLKAEDRIDLLEKSKRFVPNESEVPLAEDAEERSCEL